MAGVRGQKVGKYELLAQLTAGGMAQLFLGFTQGPGGFRKYVVIKRIMPEASSDEHFVRMFLDEARITAGFSHPGIAQVFDLGEDEKGLYVVMEFIAGRNLNEVVAACAEQRAVLPLGLSASVAHDCALALHYAHTYKKPTGESYPVVHRDVAQKNVMVTYDGQVKLLDFGIAKASGALSRTRAGTVKGTAGYMSPEQVQGEAIDGRSDLFSLGVVLWEMVTGRRLFSAETEMEELRLILSGPIPDPREVEEVVPEELARVILKALQRTPGDRWASGRELARALETRCADLLFDADQRAGFMKERFEEELRASRLLFEAADTKASEAQLDDAVRAFSETGKRKALQRSSTPKETPAAAPKPAAPKKEAAKHPAGRKAKAPKKSDEAAEREAIDATLQAEAQRAPPPGRPWVVPLLIAGVFGVGSAFAYKVFILDAAHDSQSVNRPGTAEANGGQTGVGAIPGVDTTARPPPEPDPDPGTSAVAVLPPEKQPEKHEDKSPVKEPPKPRSGEITLAILPEATVMKGKQELGRGSLMTLSLPTGANLLTVIGPDGVKRKLSLPISSGKNKSLRFRLEDLPTQ